MEQNLNEQATLLNNRLNELRAHLQVIGQEITDIDRALLTLEGLKSNSKMIFNIDKLIMVKTEHLKIDSMYLVIDNTHRLEMSPEQAEKYLKERREKLKQKYENMEKELKTIQEEIVKLLKSMGRDAR